MAQFSAATPRLRHTLLLPAVLCLAFLTWFTAELSDGFFADGYCLLSLALALGVGWCIVRLWRNLQREQILRRIAEDRLRDALPWRADAAVAVPVRWDTREPDEAAAGLLTRREREVLTLIATGLSNPEIAAQLSVSLNTVERHTVNIYRKLRLRGRAEAVAYAMRAGLAGRPR
jgi:DNA-binding NarL/FixJ family response regulator